MLRIEEKGAFGRNGFDSDPLIQVWMLHHLSQIGEAVRAVSDQLKVLDPSEPWSQIVGMRHILLHDYFGVDLDEVWSAVEKDIPPLKAAIDRLLGAP